MRTRNALVFVVATVVSAAVAGAQQSKPTTPARSSATAQAPAKTTTKTAAAQALPINSDSAKKIVASNESGATVTSAKLHRSSGKAWYNVSYHMKGGKTMHATVDANTGAFAQAAAPTSTKPSAKKPS